VTSVTTAPRLTPDLAEQIAREIFGVAGRASALPSERDQNFRIDTEAGDRWCVLKVANTSESREMLDAENATMRHLAATGLVPELRRSSAGAEIETYDRCFVRMVTGLPGRPLARVPLHGDGLLRDLGRAVGRIDRSLATFDHPALHRAFYWDLAGAPAAIDRSLNPMSAGELKTAIETSRAIYDEHVAPRLSKLRRGVIHGDVNDYNVLVDPIAQLVTGIVDFGDMVVSHSANDAAIAMAYASLDKADPLGAAALVAAGYHEANPLNEDEIAALFGLMLTRLSLSVCVAVDQQAARPGSDYLGISQGPIARTLPVLAAVHPRLAHYRLRDACGLEPVPHTPRVVAWLKENAGRIAPLTGHDFSEAPVVGLDFSAGSTLVASNPADNAAGPFSARVFAEIERAGAVAGVGGYDEARLIYATDNYATGPVTAERRTVHIGIDVTMPAGTDLFAPLDGVVHGFEEAQVRLDYGPVIVLRHDIGVRPGSDHLGKTPKWSDPGLTPTFYTLYGHLDRKSLEGLHIGKQIRAGEKFATIGAPPENGDWWPHVHVQIIADMLDVPCNFNGVAPASQRATWRSISPDTNLILGIPPERLATHPSMDELTAKRDRLFGGNVRLSYGSRPLQVARGWMQYLFDETGRTFIDAYNNVPHVGHSHPQVTEAVSRQLATLNTNSRYLHELPLEFAEELTARFPPPLQVCYFTASGSEANELALRLARAHTRQYDLIVLDAAYHGHTTEMIDVSPYKHNGAGGEGAPDWVHVAAVPDAYRDPEHRYASEVATIVAQLRAKRWGLCGFLAETCPSVGGQIIPPPGYLANAYAAVRSAGGVCIADEVQTGFGRLGTHFWAFEAQGVVPDIVVLGKPIANGYPLGAVITTREIAASFDNGMEFFSTFGGSTAACAAGLATLRATIADGLQARALEVGDHLLAGLRQLQSRHALVGDVRGSGLFIGVELVRDRTTLEPAATEATSVVNRMRELGVLTGTDGPHHNVIKIRGPMPLSKSDADCVVATLDRALRETVNL